VSRCWAGRHQATAPQTRVSHVAGLSSPYCRYDVYDSLVTTPAHFFMLRRSTEGLDEATLPDPGEPFRWKLPEDVSGLQAVAAMYDKVRTRADYGTLHGRRKGDAKRELRPRAQRGYGVLACRRVQVSMTPWCAFRS
jgi:hypothetical protein